MDIPWQSIKPDAASVTPLYIQMARKLATAILGGTWSIGEALPSERMLADALGVSRITSRKAMALLAEQGLIRRAQGAGTFIAPRIGHPLSNPLTLTAMKPRHGGTCGTHWLSRAMRAAHGDEMVQLGLSPDARVAHIQRLQVADGIVMALESSTFPATVVPDPHAIGDSPYAFLLQRGTPVVRALQRFCAVNASPQIAMQMDLAPGTALLRSVRIGYTAEQRAIELTHMYCRSDFYDLVAEVCHQPVTNEI
ncbi:GntR family transcriptional regulator [Paraburkholderia agricolaris]|uniref:GntR family transcriptional regulator n=1 Tax=Paraburkholderia agricolaris TaxID=2152888 RepID=UPI0038B79D42